MKINYTETNGDVNMTVKASNKEIKIFSDLVNVVYTLCNLLDRK